MADEYDGSVRIDARMNTDSVRIGAEQILRAINQLQQSIERSSQSMFSALTSIFEQLNGNISTIVTTIGEIANTLQTVTSGTSRTADEAARLSRELTTASDRYREIADEQERARRAGTGGTRTYAGGTGVPGSTNNPPPTTPPPTDTGEVIHAIEQEGRAIDGLTEKVRRYQELMAGRDRSSDEFTTLERKIRKTENALNALIDRRNLMQHLGVTTEAQQRQFARLGETIQYTRTELEQLRAIRNAVPLPTPEHIIQSSQALNLLSQRVSHFREVMEGKDSSSSEFKELEAEIKRVEREIEKLTSQQRAMENASNFNVQEYQRVSETLVEMRDQYHELRELRDEALNAPKAPEGWEKAVSLSGMLRNSLSKLGEVGRNAIYSIQHPVQALDRALGATIQGGIALLGTLAKKALHAAASLAKIAGNAALTYLSKLASAAKNAVIQLMKLAGNAIATGIRKIGSAAKSAAIAMLGLGKNTRKSNNSLKQAIRFLVRYGLGMRSVFALVNKLRRAIVDAFGNLAKQVPEVNKIISDMASSLDLLKNSVATAFQPLLTVVAPILVTFMDNVSAAMEKMGEFFAVLTGQGYIYKATKAQIDYAASLDKTKKKAKEAENQLAGFDHLNILKDNKSDNKEDTPTAQFTQTPVDATNTFAQKLKDAFNSGQFRTLGKVLGEKVNQIFTDIDKFIQWDKVKEPVTRFVSGITDTINGLVDRIEWENIGQTIGDGINTIANSLNLFFENIEWVNLGKALARGLNTLLDTIDPDALAKMLTNKIRAALNVLSGFVAKFRWGENGKKFGKMLSKLVEYMPDDLGQVLSDFIAKALLFMGNVFADGEIFNNIAMKLVAWTNSIFGNQEMWKNLGETVGSFLEQLLLSINTFFDGFKPDEAAASVRAGIEKLSKHLPGIATNFWNSVRTAFAKAGSFIDALFSKDVDSARSMDEAYEMLLYNKQSVGTRIGTELLNGIKDIPWKTIATDLWKAAQDAFSNAGDFATALLGITEADMQAAGDDQSVAIGTKLGEIVSQAIAAIEWSKFGSYLSTATVNLFNAIAAFFKETREQGELQKAFATFINNIDWFEIAKSIVAAAWEAFLTVGETLWQAIVDGMKHNREVSEEYYVTLAAEIRGRMNPMGQEAANAYYMGLVERLTDNDDTKSQYQSAIDAIIQSADLYGGGETEAEKFYNGFIGMVTDNGKVKDEYKAVIEEIFGSINPAQYGGNNMDLFFTAFYERLKEQPTDENSEFYRFMDSLLGSVDASSRGKENMVSYMDGGIEGINEKKSELGDTLHDAINDPIVDIETNVIEQGSPSERARKSGKWYMEGFANGVSEGQSNLDATMTTAMDSIVGITDNTWSDAVNAQLRNLNEMESNLSTVMGQMTATSTDETGSQAKPVYDNYGEIMVAVDECMRAARDYLVMYANEMTNTMQAETQRTEQNTSSGMSNVSHTVMDYMRNIASTVRQYVNEVTDTTYYGLQEMQGRVDNAMYDLYSTVQNRLNNILNAARDIYWDTIGYEITNGIYRGISNNWSWLYNTVWNLAYDLFNAAKRALGIYSPSHVFRDGIGENIGLGIAEGITNTEPDIIDTVSDLADIANETMNDAGINGEFEADGTGIVEGLDGVLNVFSNKVQSSFTDMITKLSAIAENVSFRTPNFATGTVLPYSIVSGADSGDMSDISDTISASNEELISVIIQAVNNQTTALIRAIEQNSYTDSERKSNVDSVIDEINRRTRAMGKSPLLI